jgi:hypothetical protein
MAGYAGLGVYQLLGGKISTVFGEGLAADAMINMVSPFVLVGGGTVAALISSKFKGTPWFAFPLLLALFGLTIAFPGALLFHWGGWALLLSAGMYFSKVNWFFLIRDDRQVMGLMFARGLIGPFVFLAPALVVSCLILGRNTISITETDWVSIFGIVYFLTQMIFEEFMLRRAGRKKEIKETDPVS